MKVFFIVLTIFLAAPFVVGLIMALVLETHRHYRYRGRVICPVCKGAEWSYQCVFCHGETLVDVEKAATWRGIIQADNRGRLDRL